MTELRASFEVALNIVINVGILFLMMIPGILLKKCKLCSDGFGKGVSNLVLYIAQPALIFLAYLKAFDAEVLKNCVIVLILSIVAHCVFLLALLFYKKTTEDRRRMLRFATIFSNAAFMGIPLITAVLGAEYTIYASIYNITFNMFLWTLGVHICTSNNVLDDGTVLKSEASVKKALLHPVTIAAVLGIACFLLTKYIPIHEYINGDYLRAERVDIIYSDIIYKPLQNIANLVAPLSMLVLGLRIADIDFRGFFKDKHMYLFVLLRHIALPAVVLLAMWGLKLAGMQITKEVFKVIVLMASAPAASSATMFAEKYDCDAAYVSKIVALSTILSIVTMPILAMPIEFICK